MMKEEGVDKALASENTSLQEKIKALNEKIYSLKDATETSLENEKLSNKVK